MSTNVHVVIAQHNQRLKATESVTELSDTVKAADKSTGSDQVQFPPTVKQRPIIIILLKLMMTFNKCLFNLVMKSQNTLAIN